MKTKEQFIEEIELRDKELEEKAFDIFCTEEITKRLASVKERKEELNRSKARLDELDIMHLKDRFNNMDHRLGNSPKEKIMNDLKESK